MYYRVTRLNEIGMKIALVVTLFFIVSIGYTQPRGHGRPDPKEIVNREKQMLFKKIKDLSADQKALIDGIYDEYAASLNEARKKYMPSRDWQGMRTQMKELSVKKDELMKDLLNNSQYEIYEKMMGEERKRREEKMKQRRQGQGGGRQVVPNNP